MLGTVSANNYPQIPRLASTCRPGHMRSSLFGRNFPPYTQHVESVVFGAHRKGLPGIADHHRTGHWQIATAAPVRTAPPTGLRPGNDVAPVRRAHSSTRSKNHTRRIPTRVSRSSGSSAETHSSTVAPAASPAGRPSGLGAARFLIMDRATCLRVLRGGIRRIFRSGSFTFAYAVPTHDSNYEALLTLATKFCCWRIHFCRRIQPT